MITARGFWKGRDVQFSKQLTIDIRTNAVETMRRANLLLDRFYAMFPGAAQRDATSGWRPAQVNANTKGAAPTSNHLTGKAVDIEDDDERLDKWLMTPAGKQALEEIGLWMEHPSATPRWSHVQTVQNRSWTPGHSRVFNP